MFWFFIKISREDEKSLLLLLFIVSLSFGESNIGTEAYKEGKALLSKKEYNKAFDL